MINVQQLSVFDYLYLEVLWAGEEPVRPTQIRKNSGNFSSMPVIRASHRSPLRG